MFIGILKKWFIIIKKQPKQPVVLFICSTLFNHPIQVFHPFNRPTWKKLATQRLQENTYRNWIFFLREILGIQDVEIQIQQGIQQSEHNHCSYKRFWEVSVHSCLYMSTIFVS